MNKNLKIVFKDEHTGEEQTYLEEFGIQSYIKYINRDTAVLHDDVIYIEGKSGDIEVEVAFQYTQNYSEQINAYCNRINVADGGTLVTGFKTALTRIMNQYARELNFLKIKKTILMEKISEMVWLRLFPSNIRTRSLRARRKTNSVIRMQKPQWMKYLTVRHSVILIKCGSVKTNP